jgi:hypothetical protein
MFAAKYVRPLPGQTADRAMCAALIDCDPFYYMWHFSHWYRGR